MSKTITIAALFATALGLSACANSSSSAGPAAEPAPTPIMAEPTSQKLPAS